MGLFSVSCWLAFIGSLLENKWFIVVIVKLHSDSLAEMRVEVLSFFSSSSIYQCHHFKASGRILFIGSCLERMCSSQPPPGFCVCVFLPNIWTLSVLWLATWANAPSRSSVAPWFVCCLLNRARSADRGQQMFAWRSRRWYEEELTDQMGICSVCPLCLNLVRV